MSILTAKEKSLFRKALLRERSSQYRLIQSLRQRGLGDTETGAIGELSAYDQHPGEQATETFERERDAGMLESALETLDRIDQALLRLKEGSYGICTSCGEPIEKERLMALPYALECIDCAEDASQGGRPPGGPPVQGVLVPSEGEGRRP